MTEDTPLITVGVPTFNRAKYLREALESLLAQSYRNLEIIVGDNDSKDDTAEVCREYAAKDPRVKVIRHPRNIGMVANHNCILEQARGKYFVWACDDDLWLPDFIKVMSQLLSEHDGAVTAMCRCADIVQGAQVAHPPKDFDNGETAYQSLLRYARTGDYLPICGMHETAVLKKIGGYHADSRPFFSLQ
jgi:glycosyltransferase involved in cell wall biosynthesis